MKSNLIIVIFFLTLFISCEKDKSSIGFEPGPPGSFTYQSYDSLGNLIVNGWFKIEFVDSLRVEGSWHLNNLSNRNDIGIQDGDGELIGHIENPSILINLNPQYADHNVYLDGIIKEDLIEGQWFWATFIGPTNWGSFRAIKN
jgi:hypothetical protein